MLSHSSMMTGFRAALLVFGALIAGPALSQDSDLHNSTKQFSAPADLSWQDWEDPDELERTWDAAIVWAPDGMGGSERLTTDELEQYAAETVTTLPTIIYMHGCSGIWPGTHERMKFLAANGFLVIAPVSLARETYPQSCDVDTLEAGMFRGTLGLRRNDAGYAIAKARDLAIVDGENMVLMGFSEGGIVAATFKPKDESQTVRARISEGWTCHTPWPEDRGINAPETEPVLTLLGQGDPWHQNQWTEGDCEEFLDPGNGSRSIVYREGAIADEHGLLEFETARNEVLAFLQEHLDP